jgi:tocopherol cyclase-like protein
VSEKDNIPQLMPERPGYEVWFLTLTDPRSGRGYWIRSTYRRSSSGPTATGSWFAQFDPVDAASTFGIHTSASIWTVGQEQFAVETAGGSMSSGHAEGAASGGGHQAQWSFDWSTGDPTYLLLPSALYRGPILPTKPLSPNIDTAVSGTVTVDGETLTIEEAHGQQGHVYGSGHGERWAWAHCADFIDEEAVLHALTAQGRRGPVQTPFVTMIGVRWEGRWIRLGKVSRQRDFGVIGRWNVDVGNRRYRLTGRIEAPPRILLRARYEDPDGTPRFCHNSEIASCRLVLFERKAGGFEEVALLESQGTTHAEWAGRTPAVAVESEFFEVTAP